MQINIQYDPSVTSLAAPLQAEFKQAVPAAVDYFDNAIEDNVTITIDFGWGKAGTHTISSVIELAAGICCHGSRALSEAGHVLTNSRGPSQVGCGGVTGLGSSAR